MNKTIFLLSLLFSSISMANVVPYDASLWNVGDYHAYDVYWAGTSYGSFDQFVLRDNGSTVTVRSHLEAFNYNIEADISKATGMMESLKINGSRESDTSMSFSSYNRSEVVDVPAGSFQCEWYDWHTAYMDAQICVTQFDVGLDGTVLMETMYMGGKTRYELRSFGSK